ncbi:Muscarinic acetylcholine receptor M5 [Holothuria leucospilota]|uniref:Muscarinic acetylcholine receptor M5 n=1 Tax=Holothuria leucospilota TaxID=206669 RepID=A0A9Q0YGQ6_HOLLE|nr:Muscarinic acetylcholine receptor M5 [Holothuria leucospilota]
MDGTRVAYHTQASSSNSTNEGECHLGVPEETRPYVIVGFCLIMVVTVSGNSIVIVVLGIVTNLKNDLNNYLLNLAVADLLVSLFCNPAKTFYIMSEDWTLGSSACSAFIAIQHYVSFPFPIPVSTNIEKIIQNFLLDGSFDIAITCHKVQVRKIYGPGALFKQCSDINILSTRCPPL